MQQAAQGSKDVARIFEVLDRFGTDDGVEGTGGVNGVVEILQAAEAAEPSASPIGS